VRDKLIVWIALGFGVGHLPKAPGTYGSILGLIWLGLVFVLFRFFDIVKPWPVGLSQSFPRGWGVMTDDLLAGVYVAVLMFLGRLGLSLF
jgi:phosphatidylglycerophosphatase A